MADLFNLDTTSMKLRPYNEFTDEQPVYELWQESIGSAWALSQQAFHNTIINDNYIPGDHQVLDANGQIIAFVATQASSLIQNGNRQGSLMALMVASQYQRQGHGRLLMQATLDKLKAKGVTRVQLGAGASSYFWPGVPSNLSAAIQFFEACGWEYSELSFDLVMELHNYTIPPSVFRRIQPAGIQLAQATLIDAESVLKFEGEHFPNWHQYFELAIKNGKFQDILLARDTHGAILGTVLISDKQSGILWQHLLSNNVGAIGCLGVAEHARENGIGLAMASQATEILKARGVKVSYLGWTWLVDWYGQLGYRVWREYKMSSKNFIVSNF